MVLALAALFLQFAVPHHHHEQALFLFTDSCPDAHDCHPPHGADDDCHHPHTPDTQCTALDHVVAIGGKQQGSRGAVDLELVPLLATLLVFQFGIPVIEDQPASFPDAPLRYTDSNRHAHTLRGPPTNA